MATCSATLGTCGIMKTSGGLPLRLASATKSGYLAFCWVVFLTLTPLCAFSKSSISLSTQGAWVTYQSQ